MERENCYRQPIGVKAAMFTNYVLAQTEANSWSIMVRGQAGGGPVEEIGGDLVVRTLRAIYIQYIA